MKKKLLLTSVALLSTGIAFAKNVDFDTVIKWNSEVISAALTKAGFIATSNAAFDVRKTHERILNELVKKQSFSLRQATQVCLDKCNMSDMLKNGRGQSGKKCPELCTGFVDSLVSVNNEFTKAENKTLSNEGLVVKQADGTLKVYSEDKKYYAICTEDPREAPASIKKYSNLCTPSTKPCVSDEGVVFEAQTNKAIALLGHHCGDGQEIQNICGIGIYDDTFGHIRFGLFRDWCVFTEDQMLYYENLYLETFRETVSKINDVRQKCHSVSPLDQTLISKYLKEDEYWNLYNQTMQAVQNCKDRISEWDSLGFTENSWNRYEELSQYRVPYLNPLYPGKLEEIPGMINSIKGMNGETYSYTYQQFKKPEEAYQDAKKEVYRSGLRRYPGNEDLIDINNVQCYAPPCKRRGNDIVTCTFGDVTYQVIYGDICQTKLEEFLGL